MLLVRPLVVVYVVVLCAVNAVAGPTPLHLGGIKPELTVAEVKALLPKSVCTKDELKFGNQRSTIESCRAGGQLADHNGEYIVTFANGRMDGASFILKTTGDARRLARQVLSTLAASYGVPTEDKSSVLNAANPEFEEVASWIQRPTASLVLRVCEPAAFKATILCPDKRVIVNANYR